MIKFYETIWTWQIFPTPTSNQEQILLILFFGGEVGGGTENKVRTLELF